MASKAAEAQKLLDAGKVEEAKNLAKDALAECKKVKDETGEASAAKILVKTAIDANNFTDALEVADRELGAFYRTGFTAGIVAMMLAKADVALASGKVADSLVMSRQAWPLSKKSGSNVLQAEVLVSMVEGLCAKGQYAEALKAGTSSLSMVRESGDKHLIAQMLFLLGKVQVKLSATAETLQNLEEASKMFTEVGSKKGQARAMTVLGMAQNKMGKFDDAISTAKAALELWRPMGQAAGCVAALEVIVEAKAGEGLPTREGVLLEEELAKFKKEGVNPQGEAILLEKMSMSLLEQGFKVEAVGKMNDLVAVLESSGDKPGEATKTLKLAEMLLDMGLVKEAAKTGEKARLLFADLKEHDMEESTKAFVASCYKTLGDKEHSPYRSEGLLALKGLAKAIEERDVNLAMEFEALLNKASSAIDPEEVAKTLGALVEKDPEVVTFLKELGWNVDPYQSSEHVYYIGQRNFYVMIGLYGMGFGPQFRPNHPWRKGKASDATPPSTCLVAQVPIGESWWGQVQYRHALMDGPIQSSQLGHLPPL